MTQSKAKILELLDHTILKGRNTGRVGELRLEAVKKIKSQIEQNGFPIGLMETKIRLSLLPFVFQECNYDGDELSDPKFTLVKDLLDIDFYVAFDGRERAEVPKTEFLEYFRKTMQVR